MQAEEVCIMRGCYEHSIQRPSIIMCIVSCRETFAFLHGLHTQTLKSIGKSLDKDGLGIQVHGNTRRPPKNSLSLGDLLPLFYCCHLT